MAYDPKRIEPKWQKYWEERRHFRAEQNSGKPKYYVLDMFPYPSGEGLHVGHPEGYTATDIVARYKRMRGYNVLHPMGWDAFGLPAERYAVRTGIHPSITTKQNIDNFRRQLKRLGLSYDWARELATTDPQYVRWTQWIFLKLLEKGLAYQAEIPVNWCPAQGTVLANEEVKDGRYVETGDPVERRLMRQWMLRITAYAERLLEDLETLDWPEGIKAMQRHWIGRSEGAEINFEIVGHAERLTIYTTRPETLWGATFVVVSPEHPLLARITSADHRESVNAYVERARGLSEVERAEESGKAGVFTGAAAIHPTTGQAVPIWVADYVLLGYGTGAIMGVPGHDRRDHEFARTFALPIVEVVEAPPGADVGSAPWETEEGTLVSSGFLNGLAVEEAKRTIVSWLQERGIGRGRVQYRLRDWLFSRQRYWGEPIPVVHREDGAVVPLPDDALPLLPPELADYKPTRDGQPPLARASEWVQTQDPSSGMRAVRETNTMPQWAGSCWYYLRFVDPANEHVLIDPASEKYWLPVDLYVGGAEHAVLHLLYARFWHKVLYDLGVVSTPEPFRRLFNQGMVLAFSYRDQAGKYYRPSEVSERGGKWFAGATPVRTQIEKMSKSHYNVVSCDEVVDAYGADALRLYEMFMGPLEMTKPWQTSGVAGVSRFLNRAWRLVVEENGTPSTRVVDETPDRDLARLQHKTVRAVTEELEALRFNTAVAKLMEMANALTGTAHRPRSVIEAFVLLLAPFAPHIAEELWEVLGHGDSLALAAWPSFDEALARDEVREYVVQVNGKVRHRVAAEASLGPQALLDAVKSDFVVRELLKGKRVAKEVVVPGRLVNFVVES